jgi:hypothetical protein
MLKTASYVLQATTIIALLCASVIRARTLTRSGQPIKSAIPAGLHTPAADWIGDGNGIMPVQKQDRIHQRFYVPPVSGVRAIQVENILGSIEVTGVDGDEVQIDVDKTLHAESNKALERAQKEVTFDIQQDPGLLKIEGKNLGRCTLAGCWHFNRLPYAAEMDWRLEIPRDSDLTLRTVEGRGVRVRDVRGTFSISSVNGGVTMENVAGSGTARTVNGPIRVTFGENPRSNSQFASVNGGVDLYFTRQLSADFRFQTFSGRVYSDFPILEQRHGLYLRANWVAGGRVGAGGPLIGVQTLNGDVRILERHD